jgi:hypothetical protein
VFLLYSKLVWITWSNPTTCGIDEWVCGSRTYALPYFCPFSAIECLQPITLSQLGTVQYFPGLAGIGQCPNDHTKFVQADEEPACSGFPSTITVTPA